MHLGARLALLLCLLATPALGASPAVEQARALLDQGRPVEALSLLDRAVAGPAKGEAEAWLLRSTARFELGEIDEGKADLDRALALDPALRQGWLNRAGVAIAEGRHEDALAALERARELDPAAPDNALNIGAVKLLLGRLDEATGEFRTYLSRHASSAEAFYLVASNYAMAGYTGLAVQNLQQAIQLDERVRRRARVDPNFTELGEHPRFRDLMSTDLWRPAPDAHQARRAYEARYGGGQGPLLRATLDALQSLGEPLEPQGEVTPAWALLWGEMRVKVRDAGGEGVVELSAPAGRFTAVEWQVRSKRLLDSIAIQLVKRAD